jgi:glucosamine--fructose-6-phosphate aminotransferase (isomerizing)
MTVSDGLGVLEEIELGPDMIRRTLTETAAAAEEAAQALRARGVERVFVVGNGTSFWSARWVAGWYRRLSTPEDDPSMVALSAASFVHYRPRLSPHDALLAISASGEFREVIAGVDGLPDGVPTVGVVQAADTALGRRVSHRVVASGGPSGMPVMTRTFLSTASAAALVAIGLLADGRTRGAARHALEEAADAAEAALEAARASVDEVAAALAQCAHIFVVGGGAGAIAAGEAALKLTEMALLPTQGVETWEAESGLSPVVGPGTAVVAVHPVGPAEAATSEFAVSSERWGARVVEVAPRRACARSLLLPLPVSAPEAVSPLYVVPPLTLVASRLAALRGITFDTPGWVGRYAEQGLLHVPGALEAR